MIAKLPKVMLFDWDGTLADSYSFLEGAHDYTLDKLDLPSRVSGWYYSYFGMPPHLIYADIYGDKADEAQAIFMAYFRAHSNEATQPLKGAAECIQWIRGQEVLTGVVTNMLPASVKEKIRNFGWDTLFDVVVGAGEAAHNKPAPDPIYLALERLGYEGSMDDVWFVGDTITDMAAADAAGCKSVYIEKPLSDDLKPYGYDPIAKITDYGQFLAFLQEI